MQSPKRRRFEGDHHVNQATKQPSNQATKQPSNQATKPEKKTREQIAQERMEARQRLQQFVNRVPSTFSSWGVVRTRAWVGVHKKAVSALASKRGPSINRCRALIAKFEEVSCAPVDSLVST